jgi:hypothetical protein
VRAFFVGKNQKGEKQMSIAFIIPAWLLFGLKIVGTIVFAALVILGILFIVFVRGLRLF